MSSFLLRTRALPRATRAFSTSTQRSTFAKMTLVGRLADTPEVTLSSTGKEMLKYAVATSSGRGENQKTSWFRVTGFLQEGPQRDFIASLDKGTLVYVEGHATMDSYTDKDGNPRNALNLVQSRFEALSPKKPVES